MDYSSVPKNEAAAKANHDSEKNAHGKLRRYQCCCCRLTKMQIVKVCCIATITPIILFVAVVGIYMLVMRLSYNPPPAKVSSSNDTLAFLQEMLQSSSLETGVNVSIGSNFTNATLPQLRVAQPLFTFQATVNPPWTDCGSQLAKVRVVTIESCEQENDRCLVNLDQEWMFEIAFTMNSGDFNLSSLVPQVCGHPVYFTNKCRPIYFRHASACNDSNIECPLQGSRNYLYRNVAGILQKLIPVKLTSRTFIDFYFRLKDQVSGKLVYCARIPSILVPVEEQVKP